MSHDAILGHHSAGWSAITSSRRLRGHRWVSTGMDGYRKRIELRVGAEMQGFQGSGSIDDGGLLSVWSLTNEGLSSPDDESRGGAGPSQWIRCRVKASAASYPKHLR